MGTLQESESESENQFQTFFQPRERGDTESTLVQLIEKARGKVKFSLLLVLEVVFAKCFLYEGTCNSNA